MKYFKKSAILLMAIVAFALVSCDEDSKAGAKPIQIDRDDVDKPGTQGIVRDDVDKPGTQGGN